jgi:hypothetical protein
MTRRGIGVWAAALTFSVSAAPVLAQEKGSRPGGGGEKTGTAVSRPSGGSGGSSGGGSSAGGSSAGSSSSSGGGSSSSMPSGGFGRSSSRDSGDVAPRAPERRGNDRAVARDRAGSTRSDGSAATRSASPDSASDQRRAVPAYSRPRDGRPVTGGAVDRRFPPSRPGDNGNIIYYPYYDPFYGYGYGSRYGSYGYYPWYAGYGFGLGYLFDPWGYNYYSPYDTYGGYSSGRGSYSNYRRGPVGQIRLKVKPQEGQVYVDGYYVGEVDSFDGVLQRLDIEAGAHRVEIRAPGYETVAFDVMVRPGETVTYKGDMRRIR